VYFKFIILKKIVPLQKIYKTMAYQCKICANSLENEVFIAREMMFGIREDFTYFRCSLCGCLQISEPPKDMSKFYPSQAYYSFQPPLENKDTYYETVKKLIKLRLVKMYFTSFGTFLLKGIPPYMKWFDKSGKHRNVIKLLRQLKKTSPVLDVGCGVGILLQEMNRWGFKNLTGIDPFI
jgi:2-polyprenyl-3-methyl-5-hydroxy-6-metoxy-1,4-benzoquinol methylase